ncbi:FAD-binding oxidoreductase [Suttonella sp. R2A3]|uniref:FAD-binding oxidoreductase n=1 Tax=Suttonella sp. R2A3 TaxID=2908648 RepID=UPI001F3D1183|nr:FAD-binding oxidoreductase [Suttonella sp. R2A3]UJF24573.1 FAD-binding oxidoreductase [Suttonella sp. R2A3]
MSAALADLGERLPDLLIISEVAREAPQTLEETRHRLSGAALAVVYPSNSQEISDILRWAKAHDLAIIPQGGASSRSAAALPTDARKHVVMRFDRLNRLRGINVANATMVVEAGMTLAEAQHYAAEAGLYLPLSLGSEAWCTIGGCIAHNAGGVNVLRYGNTRDQVLGLEYVLADGRIVNDCHGLRKNNTGYALEPLIIGSEGTLAVVSAATLKLAPAERSSLSVLIHLSDMDEVILALAKARAHFGQSISSFEFMDSLCLRLAADEHPELARPYDLDKPGFHVLLRIAENHENTGLTGAMNAWLNVLPTQQTCLSGERLSEETLWQWRHALVAAEKSQGLVLKHDIAVPIDQLTCFIRRAAMLVARHLPEARPYPFGHVGDGNIHYNILKPVDADDQALAPYQEAISEDIHQLAVELGGTYSAEHGIGLFKTDLLARYTDPAAYSLMQQIKQVFDPENRLNPGKLWGERNER